MEIKMGLTKEKKKEIVDKFAMHVTDTSSPQVQIALLTARLNSLNEHLKENKKDFHTRQGLMKMVGKRRSLLNYLSKIDVPGYKVLLEALNIRK